MTHKKTRKEYPNQNDRFEVIEQQKKRNKRFGMEMSGGKKFQENK